MNQQRNLPPGAEQWGRSVENSISEISRLATVTANNNENFNKGVNSSLSALSEQLNTIQQQQEMLQQQQTLIGEQQIRIQESVVSTTGSTVLNPPNGGNYVYGTEWFVSAPSWATYGGVTVAGMTQTMNTLSVGSEIIGFLTFGSNPITTSHDYNGSVQIYSDAAGTMPGGSWYGVYTLPNRGLYFRPSATRTMNGTGSIGLNLIAMITWMG